jgi:hypothetical protein
MNVRFGAEITAAARAHHLDPRLLAAVAAQETGGPGASSGRNIVGDGGHGRGLFQIDDRTWAFARTPAAMDPAQNADVAAGILADALARYGGDVRAALSAYNSGSPTGTGTRTTWADGTTLGYADSVLRHEMLLQEDSTQDVASDASASDGPTAAANPAPIPFAAPSPLLGMLGPAAPAVTGAAPFTPVASWAAVLSPNGSAGGREGADADAAVGRLIDEPVDVFGASDAT